MQARGFFASLFDYSFSSYITPRIIKVLYVLATVLVALWTIVIILVAFNASSTLGILTLLILGPIYFVLAMIYTRVLLELLSAFFRIHDDVQEINQRGGGGNPVASPPPPPTQPPSKAAPVVERSSESEPAAAPPPPARFCENCGAERRPGKAFCTACGERFE